MELKEQKAFYKKKQRILTHPFEVSPRGQFSSAQSVQMIYCVDQELNQLNHNLEENLFLSRKYTTSLEVSVSSSQRFYYSKRRYPEFKAKVQNSFHSDKKLLQNAVSRK